MSESNPGDPDGTFRLLIVTTEPHVSDALQAEIERRAGGRETQSMVVIPTVTETRFEHVAGDVDDAIGQAVEEREEVAGEVEQAGASLVSDPRIGDSDPLLAIEDGLREFPADEILVVTRPSDQAGWLEDDLFDRARERFPHPIAHFVVGGEQDGTILDEERSAARQKKPAADERDPDSGNLPPYSARDVFGIVVAVAGTVALAVIAGSCDSFSSESGFTEGGISSCAVTLLIAGAVALANIAHVVGLMLFQTVRGRNVWQSALAHLSLWGTAAGLVAAIALHA